jgi:hypothetical protein
VSSRKSLAVAIDGGGVQKPDALPIETLIANVGPHKASIEIEDCARRDRPGPEIVIGKYPRHRGFDGRSFVAGKETQRGGPSASPHSIRHSNPPQSFADRACFQALVTRSTTRH